MVGTGRLNSLKLGGWSDLFQLAALNKFLVRTFSIGLLILTESDFEVREYRWNEDMIIAALITI